MESKRILKAFCIPEGYATSHNRRRRGCLIWSSTSRLMLRFGFAFDTALSRRNRAKSATQVDPYFHFPFSRIFFFFNDSAIGMHNLLLHNEHAPYATRVAWSSYDGRTSEASAEQPSFHICDPVCWYFYLSRAQRDIAATLCAFKRVDGATNEIQVPIRPAWWWLPELRNDLLTSN